MANMMMKAVQLSSLTKRPPVVNVVHHHRQRLRRPHNDAST